MINLRFDNPAYLWDDGKDGKRFFVSKYGEYLSSAGGVVFCEIHYGFSFTSQTKETFLFSTQCPIYGAEIDMDGIFVIMKVFEIGKTIQWKVNMETVEVIQCAKFLDISRRDMEYLSKNFGLGVNDLDEVNSYLEGNSLKKTLL